MRLRFKLLGIVWALFVTTSVTLWWVWCRSYWCPPWIGFNWLIPGAFEFGALVNGIGSVRMIFEGNEILNQRQTLILNKSVVIGAGISLVFGGLLPGSFVESPQLLFNLATLVSLTTVFGGVVHIGSLMFSAQVAELQVKRREKKPEAPE